MPIYQDTELPTEEELTVPEINMTTGYMRAGSHHFGSQCDEVSKEFMLCREEERDPRKCIQEGKAVTACAVSFFQKVKANCYDEFQNYGECITKSSQDFQIKPCRKTQGLFDKCMLEKLDMPRPALGYFSVPRIHTTTRPKPIKAPTEYPGVPDELPKNADLPPAKYGTRNFFVE